VTFGFIAQGGQPTNANHSPPNVGRYEDEADRLSGAWQ